MSNTNIEHVSRGLKVAHWNINGMYKKNEDYCKLKDPVFINQLLKFDIIALLEIHCDDKEIVDFEGYTHIISTRPKAPKARKHSGGLLILLKNEIAKGIKCVKTNPGNYVWLKLDKIFFNIEKNIYLCIAYISPDNSTYSRSMNENYLSLIHDDITNFARNDLIMIMGDLNARTGTIGDTIYNDNDAHLPMDDHYIFDSPISKRTNQDQTINDRGLALIDLCISAQLRILNGRKLGDLNGDLTCYKHNGSSLVDYCIVSELLYDKINYFEVSNHLSDLSDHCMISCQIKRIKYGVTHDKNNQLKLTSIPIGYRWNSERFSDALNSDLTKDLISKFMETGACTDENVKCFNEIIYSIANRSLLKRNRTHNKKNKPIEKKWYNNELKNLRKILICKGKKLLNYPNNREFRHNYFSTLKTYRKKCKSKCRKFKIETLQKLDNLHGNNPKEYWKLIEKLNDKSKQHLNQISSSNWYRHFKSLNENEIPNTGDHQEIINDLEISEKVPIFNDLDNIISLEEITSAISSLKNGKSPGPVLVMKCSNMENTYSSILSENYLIQFYQVVYILNCGQ